MAPISFSTGTSAQQPEDSSFTQMDPDHDLESIGRHCQFEFCNQLDFLPFRCESCKGTFCLDHRTETTHKCTHAGEWAAARRKNSVGATGTRSGSMISSLPPVKPTVYNSTQCSHPSCKTLIHTLQNTGVHCNECNRQYCLKHRLREDHDCAKLVPIGARPTRQGPSQAEKARLAFSRLRTWGKDKSSNVAANLAPKPKPNSAAARMARLTELKKKAKGDPNLALQKRFYLHVEASADTTTAKYPTGDFYFDSAWSVGKVLDDAARRLQVQNVNNRVANEEERLRVFHVEGGKLLDFSEKLGASASVAQGDTIVLLRGVGPPPELIGER
ncbi:hypothetical protein GX51_02419 [Blastomyces parvus]|uniref:AN1-type domain-containing protein n=1 Tax=Blastomyces parvus TaxID=2060905 RepID=A0A2B7XCN0_9EURO|nr:hypothetical protein GX51_02419 [Blastomyces parvus]